MLDAFNNCSYRSLPPRPSNHCVFGELELVPHAPEGVSAYALDPAASDGDFHLRYEGPVGATLSDDSQPHAVNLVRNNGSPALTGRLLFDMMPQSDLSSIENQFVAFRQQVSLLADAAGMNPGDILGVAHAPLNGVQLDASQHKHRVSNP